MMHESKKAAVELNDKAREMIRRAGELKPEEIREYGLEILALSDKLRLATDEAVHWLFENELIMALNAQRDKRKVKE